MNMIENRKDYRLSKIKAKYQSHEKLLIASSARKTIRYIEKNTLNFPKQYTVLRDRIIGCCYDILENIYRANIFQEIKEKKEIVVQIRMLNFYLEEALRKDIITSKKFESYGAHLLTLDKMVRAWFNYEKSG